MVYFDTSDEWQRQTALLLQARPTTTRITTKYKIPNLEEAKYQRSKKRPREQDEAAKVARATLVLKAYEPVSGACLKFKTDRAAEVGRLVNGLGRVGRYMAALPPMEDDVAMEDAVPAEQGSAPEASAVATQTATDAKVAQAPGTGAGKKKKKNKK